MANIVRATFREAVADNITGEAAKVAFYLFLSLFPLILMLLALTGLIGGERAFGWIMGRVQGAAPPETAAFLEGFVREVTSRREPGALSLGLLLTLWAASGGFAALADGLNRMYDVEETRSWWKKRAIAIAILLAASVLLVGGALAILAGPALARRLGLGFAWQVLPWPLAFLLLAGLMFLVYYFLPARDQSGSRGWVLLGALIGALLWLGATYLFRLYVVNLGNYGATYGSVGAVIVLMLWLYLTALSILFGGEVAAVLEARRGRRARARLHAA